MTARVYAHRGASAHLPEHTRAAYLQAIADGADGVECDVHLTRDGQVVLLHDATLDRTSDGTGPVAQRSLAELRELDFWSWKWAGRGGVRPADLAQQLLTLDELLDLLGAAGRPIGVAVEFKHERPGEGYELEDTTLALLERRGWDAGSGALGPVGVSFMSFAEGAVGHLLARVPGEHVCQLVAPGYEEGVERIDDGGVGIAGPGVDYLAAHPDRVQRWVAAGRTIRAWTVNDAPDLRRCVELGVQEVTTDDPAAIRALL